MVCDNMLQGLGRYLRCLGVDVLMLENTDDHRVAATVSWEGVGGRSLCGGGHILPSTFLTPMCVLPPSLPVSAGEGGRPRHPHLWAALPEREYLNPP